MKPEIKIIYNKNGVNLTLNLGTKTFLTDVSNTDVVRYLKGIFTNKSRFKSRFTDDFKRAFTETNDQDFECSELLNELLSTYDTVEPYTYSEAFRLENREFQAMVFGSINITDMITELGHTRIKVDGIQVKHKKYKSNGDFEGFVEYDNIYETHEVSGKKIGLEENLYAVKCWCTSTNKEHWLWIEEQYKDNPLEAVASTFRLHENVIPHIKEIKRQGDILLLEMNEDVKPEGNVVPLTAAQYFGLLTAQS